MDTRRVPLAALAAHVNITPAEALEEISKINSLALEMGREPVIWVEDTPDGPAVFMTEDVARVFRRMQ